jgi:chromosome segregation ATPase
MAKDKEMKPSASTEEALAAIGQLVNTYKGLKQAEGIMQALQSAEQRAQETSVATDAARKVLVELQTECKAASEEAQRTIAAADEQAAQKVKDADARVEAMVGAAALDVKEVNKRAAALNKKLSANEAAANDAEIRRQQAEEELRNLNDKIDKAKATVAKLLE